MFYSTPKEEFEEAQRALDYVAKSYPVTMEALLLVKSCVCSGALPHAGGLEDQDCGYPQMVRWLAARGIIEGVVRGGGL